MYKKKKKFTQNLIGFVFSRGIGLKKILVVVCINIYFIEQFPTKRRTPRTVRLANLLNTCGCSSKRKKIRERLHRYFSTNGRDAKLFLSVAATKKFVESSSFIASDLFYFFHRSASSTNRLIEQSLVILLACKPLRDCSWHRSGCRSMRRTEFPRTISTSRGPWIHKYSQPTVLKK